MIKQTWNKEIKEGGHHNLGRVNLDAIAGLTLNKFHPS
jgi:hypothetical protein